MERMTELATQYGRYGYRRITALLVREGWRVNHKRVERLWRREGLKVPKKQPKRGRLWLNDGSCVRLRPERTDHVWAYDFVHPMSYGVAPGCIRAAARGATGGTLDWAYVSGFLSAPPHGGRHRDLRDVTGLGPVLFLSAPPHGGRPVAVADDLIRELRVSIRAPARGATNIVRSNRGDGIDDDAICEAARETDLLIYDAQYTSEEYASRAGWGHSTWESAVEIGDLARVGQLLLFHHDPGHDDEALTAIESQSRQRFSNYEDGTRGRQLRAREFRE